MSHEWRQATNSRKPHTYFRNTVTPSSQISQHRSVFDLRFDVLGTWIRSDCALLGPREFKRTHLSSQQEKTTSTLSNAFVIDVSCDCSSDLWTWWAQRVMLGALNMTACGHCNQILGGFRISSAADHMRSDLKLHRGVRKGEGNIQSRAGSFDAALAVIKDIL